jgi:GH35 family endo-1,4-beta-xylanase
MTGPVPAQEQVTGPASGRSLREAAAGHFRLGVGVSLRTLENPDDRALLTRHFAIVTPENCMKPQAVHPAEGTWRFGESDRFVALARGAGLDVVGHCLVWAKDDRTDSWMMTEEDGQPVSRETLLKRIDDHVRTVVGRYADAATMWDVVNEAVADSGDSLLRDSVYSRTIGIDFVVTAFKAARAKDPDALLIYNDYNDQMPEKRRRIVAFLKELKAKGAPVDAYGMQGHFELGEDVVPQLRAMFDEVQALGLKVVVSELDLDVVKRYRWWADNGAYREELARTNPYPDGLPPEIQKQLADQYAAIFRLFEERRDQIARVSFWNLHDGESWLNDFPWKRTNHPLLFDRERKPKPAFDAVYEVLSGRR